MEARAEQIHRWDLIERSDNPRLRLAVKGRWNVAAGTVLAEEVKIEAPHSNLRGAGNFLTGPASSFDVHLDSAGIQAVDLLAWYRAFHPGIDDRVSAEQFFTGALALRGWPLKLEGAAFSSNGGILHVPGLKVPVRIGPVRVQRERNLLVSEPVRIALGGSAREVLAPGSGESPSQMENAADLTYSPGSERQVWQREHRRQRAKSRRCLKAVAALGQPLNHGWELTGDALAVTRYDWRKPEVGRWNGRIIFSKAKLAIAGLNQPLAIQESTLNWKDGLRSVDVTKVNGFGGTWSGSITERNIADGEHVPRWNFSLTTDRMSAADLDRWVGPRARPNWLQRLLSSLLGGSSQQSPAASDLVRQMNADGDLNIGELTVEKLKLSNVTRGGKSARSSARSARCGRAVGRRHGARANERGVCSAPEIRSDGEARSRESRANPRVRSIHRNAWRVRLRAPCICSRKVSDATNSFASWLAAANFNSKTLNFAAGTLAPAWPTARHTPALRGGQAGEGTFTMRNLAVTVDNLTLESGREQTSLQGTVSFARDADLTIETLSAGKRRGRIIGINESGHVLKISGPLDEPRVSLEKAAARQPAD